MESCPARRDQRTILGKRHALHSAILVERNSRAPPHPVAQPLSAVADRNVLWREDAADRFPGILGIRVAGTPQSLALSKMDSRNGPLRPPPPQGSLKSALRYWPLDAATEPSSAILTSLPLPTPTICAADPRFAAISRYPMLPRIPKTSPGVPDA